MYSSGLKLSQNQIFRKMGKKRKGQLTSDSEWHKHLRKIGKRFFWKGERPAEKKMIEENLTEIKTEETK